MHRTVNERQIQIDEPVDYVVSLVFGPNIEWRRHNDPLHHIGGHRLETLILTATDGPDHNLVGKIEFLEHRAGEPSA